MRRWLLIGVSVVLGALRRRLRLRAVAQLPAVAATASPSARTTRTSTRTSASTSSSLPWLHYLVDFAMTRRVHGLLAAAVVHYLFGGIRLQAAADRLSGAAQVQLSVLLGLFVLLKAVDYWLDRFDLTIDRPAG